MSKTALHLDPVYTQHDTGGGHPEDSARITAIIERLTADQLVGADNALTIPIKGREVTDDEILRVHTDGYLKTVIKEIDGTTRGQLSTGDTVFSEDSLTVARRAAGSLLDVTDAVVAGDSPNGFCAVRPPGHHATPDKGMGFCIFNNVAIAARHAAAKHGMERIAIVDWDVHHGNGTQDIFYEDPNVFFFSTHQHPWYPGTGKHDETGAGKGKATTLNAPLPAGSGIEQVGKAFRDGFEKRMRDYRPDMVFISAGFDSRIGDPLGNFTLSDEDFAALTGTLVEIAGEFAAGRLVSVLEGGYNLSGLASGVSAHLRALTAASKE